jgi:hypothetical protein
MFAGDVFDDEEDADAKDRFVADAGASAWHRSTSASEDKTITCTPDQSETCLQRRLPFAVVADDVEEEEVVGEELGEIDEDEDDRLYVGSPVDKT